MEAFQKLEHDVDQVIPPLPPLPDYQVPSLHETLSPPENRYRAPNPHEINRYALKRSIDETVLAAVNGCAWTNVAIDEKVVVWVSKNKDATLEHSGIRISRMRRLILLKAIHRRLVESEPDPDR